jgi:hypothetical protein
MGKLLIRLSSPSVLLAESSSSKAGGTDEGNEFCLTKYLFHTSNDFAVKFYDMGPMTLLPLRRKACCTCLSPSNIHRPSFNPRNMARMASTLTTTTLRTTVYIHTYYTYVHTNMWSMMQYKCVRLLKTSEFVSGFLAHNEKQPCYNTTVLLLFCLHVGLTKHWKAYVTAHMRSVSSIRSLKLCFYCNMYISSEIT